ncbi:MAG: histone deacetylase [Thermoanaerobaculia bacterium]|nr:histone deacetylase [Thermoanaerobaculia bacterium]
MKVFTSAACLEHRVPDGFPEGRARLAGIRERLAGDGHETIEIDLERDDGWEDRVLRLHAADYVERFRTAVESGRPFLDTSDNPLSPGTWGAAEAAVRAGLAAVDEVAGRGGVAFVAARPPGHHAERSMSMGFCYFNTVAVAAQHARDAHGAERVAIFDFDVHHGNGTQHLFEDRADVFYASVHQYPFYPGTGAAGEVGIGAGVGATLNVPLPAGSGDEVYAEAHHGRIYPALEAFRPDLLLLSAGFDAWQRDLLGQMKVTEEGYRTWGRELRALADGLCDGRIVAVLEGGYDLEALPGLVSAHLGGLEDG